MYFGLAELSNNFLYFLVIRHISFYSSLVDMKFIEGSIGIILYDFTRIFVRIFPNTAQYGKQSRYGH